MALPDFNMRQLLEAGVHFGHQSHRWNPKMGKYIFGERNGIHIIDLAQTVLLLHQGLKAVSDVVATGGRVLFVGTKRQAVEPISGAAKRCAQYYVNHRWLGGMMTNWKTISHSMRKLHSLEELLATQAHSFTKKEQLKLQRTHDKLSRTLGGIKEMGGLPDLLFVIDTNREQIAIKEARCLNIPVAAILDTNCNPEGVAYPIPGNDDAGRSIAFYCDIFARAAIDGLLRFQSNSGHDVGASSVPFIDDAGLALTSGVDLSVVDPSTLAGKDVFVRLSSPGGIADDLKLITGIDLEMEQHLNDFGIFHYWQISVFQSSDISMIEEKLSCGGSIGRDGWVAQASTLVNTAVES